MVKEMRMKQRCMSKHRKRKRREMRASDVPIVRTRVF
jgi:hypothetical protein